ncbi:hypothetical protein OS493_034564 [Desmophyllum pertusum]|uniref:Uncharacterized protein n=1 Tax=Desmophyllum pertusum TaxID=174260 RepID=A0A9W9Y7V8_9CNID|nr:hypothetical protein OS493_034564 [Desmophyllum pertusum]
MVYCIGEIAPLSSLTKVLKSQESAAHRKKAQEKQWSQLQCQHNWKVTRLNDSVDSRTTPSRVIKLPAKFKDFGDPGPKTTPGKARDVSAAKRIPHRPEEAFREIQVLRQRLEKLEMLVRQNGSRTAPSDGEMEVQPGGKAAPAENMEVEPTAGKAAPAEENMDVEDENIRESNWNRKMTSKMYADKQRNAVYQSSSYWRQEEAFRDIQALRQCLEKLEMSVDGSRTAPSDGEMEERLCLQKKTWTWNKEQVKFNCVLDENIRESNWNRKMTSKMYADKQRNAVYQSSSYWRQGSS